MAVASTAPAAVVVGSALLINSSAPSNDSQGNSQPSPTTQ